MLARFERSANVFSTAMASLNGGGCVGSFSLRELMMSCSHMFQVVVVICIAKGVKFIGAWGGGRGP